MLKIIGRRTSGNVMKPLWAADELGLELHSSLDGVLSNTNIDAVTLATPHTLHTKQIVEAAKFGKQCIRRNLLH